MYYIYTKATDEEDWQASEIERTEDEDRAFEIAYHQRYCIVIIYKDDTEIWRGMGV